VTIDVSSTTTQPRSVYECSNVIDVALFTDPEEVYLVSLCIALFWLSLITYELNRFEGLYVEVGTMAFV